MRSFLSPKWIFLLNTGPLLLLLLLGYGEFSVIKTLLPPASVNLWRLGALTLALLALAGTAYAGWCWRRGREVQLGYCLLTLLLYSAVLFAYTSQSNDFVPRSVPRWLVPTDFMLFVWTFLMPTLAHAGFTLVLLLTPDEENESAGVSFGLALLLPVLWAGIFSVLTALVPHSWPTLESWVLATGLVLATLSFFFFLVRAVYLLSLSRADAWGENALIWKVLIAAVLPVAGLLVNRGLAGGWRTESGVFGNFSSPWFYGLALLNAALLWWPVGRLGRGGRLALLAGRAALFGYTFYFFLVFLPWLPLALPAIVLLGTGFLLLAPLLLLIMHVRALSEDAAWLQAHFPRRLVTITLLAGLLALPFCVTASYYHARLTLHEALEYVYAPDYAKTYDLNAASLARTLRTVRQHKSYASDFGFGAGQPYLSTYFNWLVLDNLMLSDAKLNELERVFLGVKPSPLPPAGRPNGFGRLPEAGAPAPALTAATARSTYDPRQQAWVSWLDLTIANRDTTRRAGEYRSSLRLPAGCYVSDYYLDINGRREPGLLAERKAAEWVYAQILHENDVRDPGLLSYHGPDELSLRVYPVVGATPRRTGLQLLHKEPVSVRIDGRELMLGDLAAAPTATATAAVAAPTAAVVSLSAVAKKKLPLVRRRPRYH